jgi:glutamine amidotransferase
MCRFTFYLGDPIRLSSLITDPENSLINQSTHARERPEPLNGDGFGVAWYPADQEEPGRFRSVSPAWSNQNLRSLAGAVESTCIMAHVRAASPGMEVMEANCHPFVWGRWSFMHNGVVGRFRRVRRSLLESLSDRFFHAVRGSTDSEHLFALFLEELEAQGGYQGSETMATALERAVSRILETVRLQAGDAPSRLNLVVSDGTEAVACRGVSGDAHPESLYLSRGKRYACEDGLCRMVDGRQDTGSRAVLVSSEPLHDPANWEAVPANHLVRVSSGLEVEVRPMRLD